VLLLRKGGTHFEKATRINDRGGFPYDRFGHGRDPVKTDEDHDESEIDGSPSGRQIDRQDVGDEARQTDAEAETHQETVGKGKEADAQTDQEADAQTETYKKTVKQPVFI
jgi:hypothetical protein